VKIDTGKGTYSHQGIGLITPDPHIPDSASGPSPEAPDSIVVAGTPIYFSRFPPKKRMSSPKPSKCHKQNKIELAF
jgi:hypothetical protein